MHSQREVPSIHNHLIPVRRMRECEHVFPSEIVLLRILLKSFSCSATFILRTWRQHRSEDFYLFPFLLSYIFVFLCARYGVRA